MVRNVLYAQLFYILSKIKSYRELKFRLNFKKRNIFKKFRFILFEECICPEVLKRKSKQLIHL